MNRTIQGKPNGFTLLEMVLVLLLMGLFAGLTLPFVVSTLDRIKLQSEVRQISSAIQFTRSEAISRKTLFTFNVDIEKNQYWLAIPKQEEVTQSKPIDETVQVIDYQRADETLTEGTFEILFYPRGNSSGGTIRFKSTDDKDEENIYAVTIDPITGKPRISQLEE
ncbi:MAG: prepilin-type N-terminal cleavage/methylation domain-containing protein [Nitrospina sp.]|nr:prepilin-type N-terminal cleavage/methylation domain-containing protein [Nitrospina sp.]MBT3416321.1 prepilin-type N-terminal cleavage/methylation domain-containing protein [Nitrospina sp.]MBT3858002.1 prepilin-type N-terminal cleavage/methylation domain-containing protein [Nitrospina sp.]MBT4104772.1 prepilin-type N-terminal cleavage/methylation domain-containing protein [Nitrospina sp.]MBT4388974.1 prepilin-type N-terminal cleavage/methylation domain-containing protein [Nitrospina sp.]